MKIFRSRLAVSLAALAATTMTVSPVMARGYDGWGGRHHHRGDGIDGGDVLAGMLAIGGIALLLNAASNAKKTRATEPQEPYRPAPQGGYEGDTQGYGRDARPAYPGGPVTGEPGYAAPEDDGARYQGQDDYSGAMQGHGGFDAAVGTCADEIERGDRRIDTVDNVSRMGTRTAVEGHLADGRGFACSVDQDGRIRSVSVDGYALI